MIEALYRHGIIPGFESFVKRRKTFLYWRELEESQWWPTEQLQELQFQRLCALLKYCQVHSRYFRELWNSHGLSPNQLHSLDDFSSWPITSRETMRDRASEIKTTVHGPSSVRKATGGSSGMPLQFLIDIVSNERRIGSTFRGYAWAGAPPGTRQTHLWGPPLGDRSRWQVWKEQAYQRFLYRRDFLNSFDVHEQDTQRLVNRINLYRPKVLVAYVNPLATLARHIEQLGLSVYSPSAIIVGAEKLYDHQRKILERVFVAPVFETYGSREFSLIGAECDQHHGLHLSMENLLVEVLNDDGTPTPAGEEGNVVITDLFNSAMPFVRYIIGDRAVAGLQACSCGRGLPLLKKVVGRQVDVLITADGQQLAGEFFPHLFKDYSAIRQFQVVQKQLNLIEIKLVVDKPWASESRLALCGEIERTIGPSTKLEMREVDTIPLTSAGKHRVVMGHTPRRNPTHSI